MAADEPQSVATRVRVLPAGEAAVLAVLGDEQSLEMSLRVQALAQAIESAREPGVGEAVPAYCTLLVHYNPLLLTFDEVAAFIGEAVARERSASATDARTREIPTVYGGPYGPDLPEVARLLGMPEDEVIRRHSGAVYTVCTLGFAPGQPYVVGLPPELALPRRHSPRESVPTGAVTLANQTNVYPMPNPTGWWWIGRTHVRLFDPHKDPPTYLRPGDRMKFIPVSEAEYLRLGGERMQ